MQTISPYTGIVLLGLGSAGFLLVMLFLSSWLGPKFRTPIKQQPFESGVEPVGSMQDRRFNVRFYMVAMLFILFDVEVIFMYPWAVAFDQLGTTGFWAMTSFMLVLLVGLAYVWRRGILDWNE